jgi:mono/diheme cytochrome c family protein
MTRIIFGLATLGILLMRVSAYSQMGMMDDGDMMQGRGMMQDSSMMNMSMIRHHYVMRNGIDPSYVSKRNPLKSTKENITSGRILFEKNCASCHGLSGLGDGAAGKNLEPRPSNIAGLSKMPMATDEYLFWTIAEGGVPLGTAMPAFKNTLKEDDIWEIIIYLREL